MIELLSPVGDFEGLKAAVQSGADSVYFGSSLFNARAFATNFSKEDLKNAILYAKLRNVKVNFTLNTLLKDEEFDEAISIAEYVYSLGVDSIIVQDLGLAKYIINNLPDIDVHGSTQMTIHNLEGVLSLEKLGFKRVVLSREVGLSEIEYICANSNIEIEAFVHGALCISYSGQCLFSSTIGGRSGNRGRCAQPCRLPYDLVDENSNVLDSGYLLSPRDLCSLQYIPDLIKAGVKCFKIEGRMKSPEYISVVTQIYRKYIDLALSNNPYIIDNADITRLMQVFNRGGFSSGNFEDDENLNYVCKEKPNNMGLYIGNVSYFNSAKGLVTLKTNEPLDIGDKISFEKEEHKYTISELMKNGKNIPTSLPNDTITIGRMKGDISLGDKIYKLTSKELSKNVKDFYNHENIKIPLSGKITIKKGFPVILEVTSLDNENYFSLSTSKTLDVIPIDSISNPLTEARVLEQLSKTTNTMFEFKNIVVDLDDNCYLPKISAINQLRRDCLAELENLAIKRFERIVPDKATTVKVKSKTISNFAGVSLLLNELNPNFDYSRLKNVQRLYIPLKYFSLRNLQNIIANLSNRFNIYIYMPTIVKGNYKNIIYNSLDKYIENYHIKGIVVSNISSIYSLKKYFGKLDLIANYTLNVFNNSTIKELALNNISMVTLSPELDKTSLSKLANTSVIPTELMVYGRLPIMNMGYCLLGSSNKCYPTCRTSCTYNHKYFLRDRLGYNFRIIPDNTQTVTTIYNSKITSIPYSDINPNCVRISILDESIDEINNIIDNVTNDTPFTGKDFTNGNLNKNV